MMGVRRWEVVGGGEKGGLLVRDGPSTTAAQLDERLTTGSIVDEMERNGDRIRYALTSGNGPQSGWVALSLKGKELLKAVEPSKTSSAATAAVTATASAEARPTPALKVEDVDTHLLDEFLQKKVLLVEPPGDYLGGQLPVMPRTVGLPTWAALPDKDKKRFPERSRKPMIRLYCFPGAADNYMLWLELATSAPEWCEVAVYEPRAHGFRPDEPWDLSLEERAEDAFTVMRPAFETHARGGVSEGAPFGFLSHGVGGQFMALLAYRLKQELNLEPLVVFSNDGPPPNVQTLSEQGYQLLHGTRRLFKGGQESHLKGVEGHNARGARTCLGSIAFSSLTRCSNTRRWVAKAIPKRRHSFRSGPAACGCSKSMHAERHEEIRTTSSTVICMCWWQNTH
ncbi:unnamed protein product [Effrenium voratum]|nr:unnamed protein product [Effrenium voratum]